MGAVASSGVHRPWPFASALQSVNSLTLIRLCCTGCVQRWVHPLDPCHHFAHTHCSSRSSLVSLYQPRTHSALYMQHTPRRLHDSRCDRLDTPRKASQLRRVEQSGLGQMLTRAKSFANTLTQRVRFATPLPSVTVGLEHRDRITWPHLVKLSDLLVCFVVN